MTIRRLKAFAARAARCKSVTNYDIIKIQDLQINEIPLKHNLNSTADSKQKKAQQLSSHVKEGVDKQETNVSWCTKIKSQLKEKL